MSWFDLPMWFSFDLRPLPHLESALRANDDHECLQKARAAYTLRPRRFPGMQKWSNLIRAEAPFFSFL